LSFSSSLSYSPFFVTMNVLRIIFLFTTCLQLTTCKISTIHQEKFLLCCRVLSFTETKQMSIALLYQENRARQFKMHSQATIQQLLLVISGTVEVNPGPRNIKFPCRECSNAVKRSQRSIAFYLYDKWYHIECVSMGDRVFDCYATDEQLEWTCQQCVLQNISTTLFDTSFSSDSDASVNIPTRKSKAKRLRISICNFQSIWNKRNVQTHFLKCFPTL
jgi:hypothetical protein